MGYSGDYIKESEDSVYKYWNGKSTSDKIHKQIATTTDKTLGSSIKGGEDKPFKYSGTIYNCAGVNAEATQRVTGNGSYFWLSYPYVYSDSSDVAYSVYYGGGGGWGSVYYEACPLAPNFCI